MGSVPTIARHASRSAPHQFDGMIPEYSPCTESGERRRSPLAAHFRCGGGIEFSWMNMNIVRRYARPDFRAEGEAQ